RHERARALGNLIEVIPVPEPGYSAWPRREWHDRLFKPPERHKVLPGHILIQTRQLSLGHSDRHGLAPFSGMLPPLSRAREHGRDDCQHRRRWYHKWIGCYSMTPCCG